MCNQHEPASDLVLGIPFMDEHHQMLIARLQDVALLPDSAFVDTFCALIDDVDKHFREEEEQMEATEFWGLSCHRAHHANALSVLHSVRVKVLEGHVAEGREVNKLFLDWLKFHISTMDSAFASELKKLGEGVAPQQVLSLD